MRQHPPTAIACVAMAIALVVVTAGCGINAPQLTGGARGGGELVISSFEDMVAAAEAEGTVTVYSTETEEHLTAVIAAFEAQYPITVEYVRLASSAVVQRFAAERDSGVVAADVIQLTDTTIVDTHPEWFQSLEQAPLPSLDAYEDRYKSEYHAAGAIYASGLQYNTDLVPPNEVPDSWDDLLSPKYQGKILLVDPKASPTPVTLLEVLRRAYGDDFLTRLGEQDLDTVDSAGPGAQQVAAGAYAFNFPTAGGAQSQPLMDQGAHLDYVLLSPGTVGTNEIALPLGSPHPNAGALFANFRMSHAGFKAVCDLRPGYGLPFDEDMPGCVDMPEDTTPVDFGYWVDDELKRRQLEELGL